MPTVLKATLLAAVIGTALFTIETSQADTPARRISEQRSIASFSAIELSGPYDVAIDAQGRPGLTLAGEREQLDGVETFVRGDTLVVRPVSRKGFTFNFGKRREGVTIRIGAAQLKRLAMSGSGDVTLDQVNGERIALQLDGPGDLLVAGAVRDIVLKASGSGDADLHRVRASNIDVTMSGPGDVLLAQVDNGLQARLSGSGDLEAQGLRVRSATLRLDGPGDATLAGSVDDFRADVSGSGDLDGSSLSVGKAAVTNRGPGDIVLDRVADSLEAELSGSGGLSAAIAGKRLSLVSSGPGGAEISGRVDLVHARLSGSGDLDGSRLTAGRADIAVSGPGSARVQVPEGQGASRLLVVQRGGAETTQ